MTNQPNNNLARYEAPSLNVEYTAGAGIAPRKLAEVINEIDPQGIEVTMEDLDGKTVTVFQLRFFDGEFGTACHAKFTDENGELYHAILGGTLVTPKLQMAARYLPVELTLHKVEGGQHGYYWTID